MWGALSIKSQFEVAEPQCVYGDWEWKTPGRENMDQDTFPYLIILSRVSFPLDVICGRHAIGCHLLAFQLFQMEIFPHCDEARQVLQTLCT